MAIAGQGSGMSATLGDGTTTYTDIISIGIAGQTCSITDISSSGSASQCAEFLPGIIDAGYFTVALRFGTTVGTAAETEVGTLKTTFLAREIDTWTLTLPGGATWVTKGFISRLGQALHFKSGVQIRVTIKLTGVPAWTAAS